MRALLPLFVFLFYNGTNFLSAQELSEIYGTVTDENNHPLEIVNIGIQGTSIGTTTGLDGSFTINNLQAGDYKVIFSNIGYNNVIRNIKLNHGESAELTVILQEVAYELQSVEITGRKAVSYDNDVTYSATKTATPIKEIPQAISYITKEVMADQQSYRVNDVVKNISGINQYSYYNDYTIRGFRSQQELINGLRVIGLFGPQVLTANLERVEVIKGPASAVFGNSAPGGTMNRVTKKPLDEHRKAISFTTGSFNTLRSTIDATGPLNSDKSLLYRLNLAYENSDNFRDLQVFKSLMIAPSISFLPTEKTRINFDLVVTGFDGKLDRGQPIYGATAGTDLTSTPISFAIGAANDYHKTDVAYSTLSLNHQLADNLSFNASYMRYSYNEDLYEHRTSNLFAVDSFGNQIPTLMGMRISAREQKQVTDNITTYFVWDTKTGPLLHKLLIGHDFIQSTRPIGGASIFTSSGAIYRTKEGGLANYDPNNPQNFIFEDGRPKPNIPHFDLENPTFTIGFPSDYLLGRDPLAATRYSTRGFYIQDQVKWGRFQFLLGLRQEFYTDIMNFKQNDEESTQQEKLLPRLGVVYQLNNAINLYGTYTESFQPQNPADLVESNGGPFDPTSGEMVEVGAKGTFFNNHLSTNLAIYTIQHRNILISDINTGLLTQRGAEEASGLELDINGRIGPNLSLTANYAYNNATIVESDNEELIGERKENAPLHSGGFFANYGFSGGRLHGININFGGNFVAERNTLETELQLPSYSIFDAGISYKVNKVKIALTANNIFNKIHWVGGYGYHRLFPGAPRSYLMSIAYTF